MYMVLYNYSNIVTVYGGKIFHMDQNSECKMVSVFT